MSEVIAAAIGALVGFGLLFVKETIDRRRHRGALASAMVVELGAVLHHVACLQQRGIIPVDSATKDELLLAATPILNSFGASASLFSSDAIVALTEFTLARNALEKAFAALRDSVRGAAPRGSTTGPLPGALEQIRASAVRARDVLLGDLPAPQRYLMRGTRSPMRLTDAHEQ